MAESFDAVIVGAGQAGTPLAGRLSAAGMRVALVERHLMGGTCVNTGCTPTKALVASARAAYVARRAADWGVTIRGEVGVDFAAIQRRQQAISANSRESVEAWVAGMERCTLYRAHARFLSPNEMQIGDEVLTAPRIFLNLGGRAVVPDLPGVHNVPTLDNTSVLRLDTLPSHLVIVGGSYIGLEFAQIFRRFGSAVTVIEKGPRLIGREDIDISHAVKDILEAEGIAIRVGAECIRFRPHPGGVAVGVNCAEGEPEVVGSHVLLAMGRKPNTDDAGLDKAGIAMDARGFITVDDHLQTNVPGIYALGDCNGRGAFTHTAYNDFEIVAANLLDDDDRSLASRVPAYALYIDPPLGRVGPTEAEAKDRHRDILVGQRPMTRVGRAVEKGETQGLMKAIVDPATDKILGAAILGPGGDEAIHGLLDMMNAGASANSFRRAMPIHPTVSELIPTILGELQAR